MKKPMNKVTRILLIICAFELLIFMAVSIMKPEPNTEPGQAEGTVTGNELGAPVTKDEPTESVTAAEPEETTEPEYYSLTGEFYESCDHDFDIYRTEAGIMSTCNNCYMPQWRLAEMGVLTEAESCGHGFEAVWLSNGMPAFECNLCGDVQLLRNPNLDDLELLSDTNPEGMGHQVQVGTFVYGATDERFEGAVCFKTSTQEANDATEAAEFLLGGNYVGLNIQTQLEPLSAEGVNMTVRCYGDGEILYQMENVTAETLAENTAATIEVFDIQVLRIECTATTDVEGGCIVEGVLSY